MNNLSFLRNGACQTTLALCLLVITGLTVAADRTSDIRSTKHNLSAYSGNAVKATTEDEVCVFCHTPHAATEGAAGAPLWNRTLGNQSYTKYQSSSLDAYDNNGPDGKSKLCLSCHDGLIAIGSVNVSNGGSTAPIAMGENGIEVAALKMPDGGGTTTGFTRNLGTDLSNDHPISFLYDSALATRDTELRNPDLANDHLGISGVGNRPLLPLDGASKMQCTSCHDPHITGLDLPEGTSAPGVTDNIKFLRGKRFQMAEPAGTSYKEATDMVCLGCHDKLGTAWSSSVHANSADANEKYTDAAATLREFPLGIQVWQAGCLNCHDTHTVQGSRRLLREGTDSTASPKAGGKPAIEQTCYQCHSDSAETILESNTSVPDIKSEFARTYKMPITTYDGDGNEVHDIGKASTNYPFSATVTGRGANFIEAPESLGKSFDGSNLGNRHVECTDCHNPHRMIKNERYNGKGASTQATHNHKNLSATDALNHNAAPGALKGTFGVEISFWDAPQAWSGNGAEAFGNLPSTFAIRCGVSSSDCDGNPQVTKEYQVCFKCHSNYAYEDTGDPDGHPSGNGRPNFASDYYDSIVDGNELKQYTNQAMEFYAPSGQAGERVGMPDSGAHERYQVIVTSHNNNTNGHMNHRSWHPVMQPTGRTLEIRDIDFTKTASLDAWLAPWLANVGQQTMMCSDCHNNGLGNETTNPGSPGGPHGSANPKLLRGTWTKSSWLGTSICIDCHNQQVYTNNGKDNSGFKHKHENEGRCQLCHIAIPHGWKNKSFLVNLNDIGPEVRCRATDRTGEHTVYIPNGDNEGPVCTLGNPIPKGSSIHWKEKYTGYTNPPYYNGAVLSILTFRPSGPDTWSEVSCGDYWTGNKEKDFMDICP